MIDDSLNEIEPEKLAEETNLDPALFMPKKPNNFTKECLNEIGISYQTDKIAEGFIKTHPSDFIVEEISIDKKVSTVETKEGGVEDIVSEAKPQIEFDLVKIGLASVEAARRLSEDLSIPIDEIKYAGLKDSKAITSQKVVISGKSKEEIEKISLPQMFIKNIHTRKGTLNTGDLWGNRFTILVRTNKKNSNVLMEKVKEIQKNGFPNFFSLQRFGTRLLGHKIGLEIINNDCEKAAKILLFEKSDYESRLFGDIREKTHDLWRNWPEMKKLYSPYPSYFAAEISIVSELEKGSNFFQAFKNQGWTTRIFIYAFTSFYFNMLLSTSCEDGKIPDELPVLNKDPETLDLYDSLLKKMGFERENIISFPIERLISDKKVTMKAKVFPQIHKIVELHEGYLFVFDLDRGAYATTFLSNLFDLMQFGEQPDWLNTEKVDTLKLLGRESVLDTEEKLNISAT